MQLSRNATPTLTPTELDLGDSITYTRHNGEALTIELLSTKAYVLARDYARYNYGGAQGDISHYGFECDLKINGADTLILKREVGAQAAFYEPVCIDGVNIWLDAVKAIFHTDFDHRGPQGGFLTEKDMMQGLICMPRKAARFALQDADRSICPEPLSLWCENDTRRLDAAQCYNGEDCWMGPYGGKYAHSGLDINMPAGSQLYTPFTLDDQYYVITTEAGFHNNRWDGFRKWEDKAVWHISASHIIEPLVPEHCPLPAGKPYATSAGTAYGAHQHTHFNFYITDQGGSYLLDPWILFWQSFKDNPL